MNALPQGSPASPIVSNMICMRMDRQLLALAKRHHCSYSRYADDLTFSQKSGAFPPELCRLDEDDGRAILGEELRGVIRANGFTPHAEKTWLFSRLHRQSVTGLVVNSKRNVPRQFVRRLRAMIHAWKVHGLKQAEKEHREKYNRSSKRAGEPAPFNLIVRGKLEFLRMTKGVEDPVYRRLQGRLVEADPDYLSVMQKENDHMKRRDVFISHASEDKEGLARPLAEGLLAAGVSVWYDEYCIRLGDDILFKIEEGLVNSQFGVIIFSPRFFEAKKTWTLREYTGLVAGEDVDKGKRIIPIWHDITRDELYTKSPTIIHRAALKSWEMSVAEMAKKIAEHIRDGRPTKKRSR
jgi:hypothetical protein